MHQLDTRAEQIVTMICTEPQAHLPTLPPQLIRRPQPGSRHQAQTWPADQLCPRSTHKHRKAASIPRVFISRSLGRGQNASRCRSPPARSGCAPAGVTDCIRDPARGRRCSRASCPRGPASERPAVIQTARHKLESDKRSPTPPVPTKPLKGHAWSPCHGSRPPSPSSPCSSAARPQKKKRRPEAWCSARRSARLACTHLAPVSPP